MRGKWSARSSAFVEGDWSAHAAVRRRDGYRFWISENNVSAGWYILCFGFSQAMLSSRHDGWQGKGAVYRGALGPPSFVKWGNSKLKEEWLAFTLTSLIRASSKVQ